ncbi:MAG: DUF2066 domain-containing protein [Gammaproteobacteria bacterium]|jgi:hypothetical protein|nr:DUF2066 domain-containing protein [Gammaproteobacteria bacterium]MBP6050469.1 DUF2066 domain-containing protein [Pseudomonadales bacterium]MBK6583612.1 DUF2066 domain-containing protein [Gammaproteobacteria bacterium]MBK7169882.1 DUF2066 domain-containing protein [Gammaproteobacteria bacterium]MBK7521950.1 DUF2066 domain-containing protein [Gammaproteobacteria bacterium]
MSSQIALRGILAMLLVQFALVAFAEPVSGLYEAEVAVADQEPATRNAAARTGFAMVLVKVSGSAQVLQNPVVSAALADGPSLLQQFYFRRSDLPPRDNATAPELLLHMSYAPAAVLEILRRAGEPQLSPNRPGTLLWLALDEGAGPRIVSPETDGTVAGWLRMDGARRGIPLLFPALDLEDSLAVSVEQVAALDASVLVPASQRYGADAIVIGHLVRAIDGQWQGEWQQQIDGETVFGQATAASVDALGAQLVDALAETLAQRYAVRPDPEHAGQLRIRIDGVGSFAGYWQLSGMLRELASVRRFQLALVDRDTLFFDLSSDASIESIEKELSLLRSLHQEGAAGELRYRWVGE